MRNSQIYIDSIFAGLEKLLESPVNQEAKFAQREEQSQSYIDQATHFLGIGDLKKQKGLYLSNIFEKIYPPADNSPARQFNLRVLSIAEKGFFPSHSPQDTLSELEQEFKTAYDKLPQNSQDTLYYLLKKYFSRVPVNADKPYINAFEFLKLRSAFAQCLSDFELYKPSENETDLQFLMLCIDISGIQNFIYNIASGKAAKSLKGRSFYLQLMMDSLIQRVVRDTQEKDLNTSIGHTIYASGGKAYLLLPNLPQVIDCIVALEAEVEQQTYNIHAESLYVLMDFVAFGYDTQAQIQVDAASQALIKERKDDIENLEIADLWTLLSGKITQKKQKKYQRLFTAKFEDFFGGQDKEGKFLGIGTGYDFDNDQDFKTCHVTGQMIEGFDKNKNLIHPISGGEDVWVLESVKRQADLGKALKSTEFYITYQGGKELSDKTKYYSIQPINLEVFNYLKNESDFISEYEKVGSFKSLQYSLVRRINNLDFLNTIQEKGAAYGFVFYGGNQQALTKDRKEKDFSDLADFSEETEGKGFHRLGVLRMDVDGLGGLFADDMKAKFGRESLQNFPAYAMVSAQLDTFYAGYLNTLRTEEKYRDWVNILYSGGDDVFAIGRWDLILDFAHEVQQKFQAYASSRLTLSAGVALITPKFPISKGADMAGEAEKDAKKFEYVWGDAKEEKTPKKNAISLLGEVVSWHKEFDKVKTIRDQLIEFDKVISASFRQKLIRFQAIKNKHVVAKQFNEQSTMSPDLSYKWQSAYFIAQLARELKGKNDKAYATLLNFQEDLHKPEEQYLKSLKNKNVHYDKKALGEFLCEVQQDLFVADRNFDLYALAARWAGLLLRNKNRNSTK